VTASVTLEPPHPWVPGTTVSLYKGIRPSSGLPSGSPVTSATVDVTDLSLVFDGLAEGGTYFAYASGQSVAITASPMSLLPEKTVSDYWIAGDADDTNAFSRAVDAVIADGRGVVRFQSGKTYTISSISNTVDNLTILAYGAYIKSTLGKTTAVTVVDLHGNNLQVLGGTWDYTTTSTVNTDASARVSAFYFRFGINNPGWTFYTGLLVRDTLILNSRNTGIGVYATSRARVLSNTIITALGNGMFCSNNPFDLEIVGNFIYDTGDDAIAVVTDPALPALSKRVTITHNHLYAVDQGIDCSGIDGGLIDYNHVELTWANAIFVWHDTTDNLGNCKNVKIGDHNTVRDGNQLYGTAAAQTARGVLNPTDRSTWRASINSAPASVKIASDIDRIELGFPEIINPGGLEIAAGGNLTGTGVIRRTDHRGQPVTTSNYIGTPGCNVASAVLVDGRITYCKIGVPKNAPLAKNVAIRSTGTVGSAGSVVRLGIYLDNGFSSPGRLLIDIGTVDMTTAGNKVLSISGGAGIYLWGADYWLAAASQGGAATQPTVFQLTGQADGTPTGSDASLVTNGYFGNSVSGALPSTATINGFATNATAVRLGF
jgi:hypothetical protein